MSLSMTSLRSTFVLLTAAAVGMAALLAFLPAAGHDQLWCFYVAQHVMDGTRLYGPELLESNPPLIVWLSMFPAALAHGLHLPAGAVGKALVVLLEAVALRQVRRLVTPSGTQLAALAFAFVAIFNVVPARDLGQRDYLLALLCLPYLLAASGRVTTKWNAEHILVGLAAGLGLALKPHQTVLPVAIELYLIIRSRSLRLLLRPEPLAIVTVGLAYVAAIHKLTPEYLTTVLPILRDTYWAVGSLSLPNLIWQAIELHTLAAVAIFFHWKRRRDRPEPWALDPVPCMLIAGAASTLAYYLQGTGWYYQQLPALSFFGLALVFEALPLLDRPVRTWVPKAAAALAILALALTTHFMNYPFTADRSFAIDTPDPAFFADLTPGTAVATLTTTVDYTVMPAARYGLTIAQRYPHLWMLPAILRSEQPEAGHTPSHIIPAVRLAELDRLQHQFMTEDLQRWQPALVLVERCQKPDVHCQLLEDRDDDLLAWFLRDPAFAATWRHYTFTGSRGPFDAYTRTIP